MKSIQQFDQWLLQAAPCQSAHPVLLMAWEGVYFWLKQCRAGIFAGLLLLAFFIIPATGLLNMARDDILLILAISIQAWMVKSKLLQDNELKILPLCYLFGWMLEYFNHTTPINPSLAVSSIHGIPLVTGFIYVAIGSYILQAWRLFSVRIRHYPPYWMAGCLTVLIYINLCTTQNYTGYLTACALGLYAPSIIRFKSHTQERQAPLLVSTLLIEGVSYLAESISYFNAGTNPISIWSNTHEWQTVFLVAILTISIIVHSKKYLKPA